MLANNKQPLVHSKRENAPLFALFGRTLLPFPASLVPNSSTHPNRGFSLIELLVSMTLFIVVLVMAVGSLLVLINANAKAQNMQSAVSNVQFALDSMAREIRTGFAYYCSTSSATDMTQGFSHTSDCASKGVYLSIIEGGTSLTGGASNGRIAYRYDSTTQSIQRKLGVGSWVRLTDPKVVITTMHFNVANTSTRTQNGNLLQPNVTIYVSGHVAGVAPGTDSSFTLQTTVTKRVLDL